MLIRAVLVNGGDEEIGRIEASLLSPLGGLAADDVCRYAWLVEAKGQPDRSSEELGTVEHRHGDGTWALVAAIVDRAGGRR